MLKNIFFASIMLVSGTVLAQTSPGFNIKNTCEFPNTQLYNLLVDNDTIVGLGTTRDSIGNVLGLVLMKFDTFGNVLTAKLLQDTLIGPNPLEFRWGSFLTTPDGGYIMNVIPFAYSFPVILKTDKDFNIEFIKKYTDPNYYSFFQCELKPVNDGYILHGVHYRTSDDMSDGFVRKIDFNGESIWMTVLGGTGSNESVVDAFVKNDSTIVAAMVSLLNQSSAYSSLITLNGNGDVTGTWNSEPEPEIGYLRSIVSATDEGYLTYGLYVAQVLPPNNTLLVMSTFSKLDNDFNIEKVQHYGKKATLASEIMFYNFAKTIEGNYVASGRTSMTLPDNGPSFARGWIMKFSPEGDSIWSRLDTSDVTPVHYLNQQKLGGVGVLSSGSIVAGGYVTKVEDNSSYIWLIKTTNDGCIDTLYCGLVSGTEEVPPVPQGHVSVYPNPASSEITISIGEHLSGGFSIAVHSLQGKLLCTQEFEGLNNGFKIQTGDLPSGLYFLVVRREGQRPVQAKFIIQR